MFDTVDECEELCAQLCGFIDAIKHGSISPELRKAFADVRNSMEDAISAYDYYCEALEAPTEEEK